MGAALSGWEFFVAAVRARKVLVPRNRHSRLLCSGFTRHSVPYLVGNRDIEADRIGELYCSSLRRRRAWSWRGLRRGHDRGLPECRVSDGREHSAARGAAMSTMTTIRVALLVLTNALAIIPGSAWAQSVAGQAIA